MLLQRMLNTAKNTKILQRLATYNNNSFPPKLNKYSHQRNKYHTSSNKVFIMSPIMAVGAWNLSQQKDENETKVATTEILFSKADALFDQGKYKEIYDLLSNHKDNGDVEVLWRLSRALYNMSKTASEVEAKNMIFEGFELLSIALSITEDNWAVHKWMSIFLDAVSAYKGMKARLKQLYTVKNHMMKASQLNTKDATVLYMLGSWCYQVSDLAWYQRKLVAVIFGEAPNSSFQEALEYFETAEKIDPNFYSHNLLMLGKTYLKLNNKEKGLHYLKKAADFPARNDEDHVAKQEAQQLLNSI